MSIRVPESWRLNRERSRRKLVQRARAGLSADAPWSTLLVLALAAFALAIGLNQADLPTTSRNHPSPEGVVLFVAVAALALWAIASLFSRRTLRSMALVLLVLLGVATLALGRNHLRSGERDEASRLAARLDAELTDLSAETPGTSQSRADADTALKRLDEAIARAKAQPKAEIASLAELVSIAAALRSTLASATTSAQLGEQIDAIDRRVADLDGLNEQALVALVTATVERVRSALAPTDSGAVDTARASVAALRETENTAGRPQNILAARAKARRDVARAVDAARSTDETKKAAAQASAAYLAAEEQATTSNPTALLDGFSAGGRALLAGLPEVGEDDVPFALGLAGWLALAGLGLMGYRALEKLTGRGELALAEVEQTGVKDDTDGTLAQFRTYLARNIPEPTAVPGATSALKPLTDLLAADQATPAGLVSKLVTGVANALEGPRGATVSFSVFDPRNLKDAAGNGAGLGAAETMVAVRVVPAGTAVPLQHTVRRRTRDQALRAAAYWTAATLIQRSRRVPKWAVWSPDAAEGLGAYYAKADTGTSSLDDLVKAVGTAPRSGLLLVELANRQELENHMVDAFATLLRAVMLYPRWPLGRYRLAATVTMLAGTGGWHDRDSPQLRTIAVALKRSSFTNGEELAGALMGNSFDEVRRNLCQFAEHLLDPKDLVGLKKVFSGLFRTTERSFWFSLLKTRERVTFRTQYALLAKSACVVAEIRRGPATSIDDELEEAATKDDELTWQLAYNLACAYAELARRPADDAAAQKVEAALTMLEVAVTRPGGYQLTREWLHSDPDLAPLREEKRFEHLASVLPEEGTSA